MKKHLTITRYYIIYFIFLISVISVAPVSAELSTEPQWEEEGICAKVSIQISQNVAITRTAFKATLEINNAPENVPIENLTVTLDVQNSNQEDSNSLFVVNEPELTGLGNVNGDGVIEPGESGKAVWIIIPTRDAAPEEPTKYFVGGTLSYTQSGTLIKIPLFPASITVKPDPLLVLNYFLPREVYSDDPFTKDIVEPVEPFSLGLILSNQGKGVAKRVKISSSQPKIIDNEKGLLVDFQITGTQVNTETVSPSMTVDLGEIEPAQTSVVQWLMTTSLSGKFISDKSLATFEHTDELGDKRTSLIDSVNMRESIHTVRVDLPNSENLTDDDKKPDFLVNDIKDDEHLPDILYKSDGSTAPVNIASGVTVNGKVSNSNLEVKLTGSALNGWVYIKVDEPGKEIFKLKKVVRSDGREIRINDNAWTTHHTIRLVGNSPYRENLLHIFDYVDSGSFEYSLIFEGSTQEPNGYKVLTESSPPLDIAAGEKVKVFGSAGVNTINVFSDAKVECVNFPGANVINFVEDSSSEFTIHRSGATVYFENSEKGTTLKIPATKTIQSINFNGGVSYNLVIINNKVMIGTQIVTLTSAAITGGSVNQPTTISNTLGMIFNLIPAGTFTMGSPSDELGRISEETQHQVTLTSSYYMQTTEVTQGQWKAVMGSNPSYFQNCGEDCPVEQVSWNDVQTFITKLNAMGQGRYALPTEAQWEYAAKAGSTTAFANGVITVTDCSYDSNLDSIGWYCGNADNTSHTVAQKDSNNFGLYDMHGNVWEWCQDWYGSYSTVAVTNPVGPETGSSRVLRGGCWIDDAQRCRSAIRAGGSLPSNGYYLGFRLVCLSGHQ